MKSIKYLLPAILLAACSIAQGQATPTTRHSDMWSKVDLGVAAAGQFTTSVTNQTLQVSPGPNQGMPLSHYATGNSPAAVVTLHVQPRSWVGLEMNYQFTRYAQRFVLPINATTQLTSVAQTSVHEGTVAYLVHLRGMRGMRHMHKLNPYLAIGGGALDFQPPAGFDHQWRGTALADLGFDMQTSSRLGFRLGARSLFYRAPDFSSAVLASSRWVSTEEPYAGVYVKF